MTAVDVSRIPRRRPGRPLPGTTTPAQAPTEEPPLPVSRPVTSAGWAPPYTDTPDEIKDRRAALLADWRRADDGHAQHSAATWDLAITAAMTDLTVPAAPAA